MSSRISSSKEWNPALCVTKNALGPPRWDCAPPPLSPRLPRLCLSYPLCKVVFALLTDMPLGKPQARPKHLQTHAPLCSAPATHTPSPSPASLRLPGPDSAPGPAQGGPTPCSFPSTARGDFPHRTVAICACLTGLSLYSLQRRPKDWKLHAGRGAPALATVGQPGRKLDMQVLGVGRD